MRIDTPIDSSMKMPLLSSVGLHIILIILTTVGLPFVAKDPLILNTPITVELVEPDKITQTPKPAPPKEQSKPSPPKMTAETPPDLTIPDPVKKPPPPEKEQKKPEKKPDPKVTKVEKEKPKPKQDFSSLLKNLTPDLEEKPVPETPPDKTPDKTVDDIIKDMNLSRLGDRLTMSEQDALRGQLGKCWNVLSGAKYAENLVVEIRVLVNADRTVNQASILDQGRYNRNPAYRAAADAALWALRNPRCSPLALPPEKYDEWKTMVITFDPREML